MCDGYALQCNTRTNTHWTSFVQPSFFVNVSGTFAGSYSQEQITRATVRVVIKPSLSLKLLMQSRPVNLSPFRVTHMKRINYIESDSDLINARIDWKRFDSAENSLDYTKRTKFLALLLTRIGHVKYSMGAFQL